MKKPLKDNITIIVFYTIMVVIAFASTMEMMTVGEAVIAIILAAIYQK